MDVAPATYFEFSFPSHEGACYTSASSSPTRLTDLFLVADDNHNTSHATIPFAWEEKPGVPKTPSNLFEDDFTFNVSSCHFDSESVQEGERGRERGFSTSSRSRRTRSLSPLGSSYQQRRQQVAPLSPAPSSDNNGSRKWSLLDLLLFRSASDGRAMDRDPLRKYFANFRKYDQDVRNSGSVSKPRGRVSAHELHYNVNRAVSNDMKKKTYLPYKQGILGRFSFNP